MPRDVLPFDRRVTEVTSRSRATTASVTARIDGGAPSTAAIEVTARSRMPHGTMWSNIERSGSTFSAKP